MTSVLLASLEADDLLNSMGRLSGSTRDALLIFGALIAVTVVLLLWATFIRKKRDNDRGSSRYSSDENNRAKADPPPQRRKWRRRRRAHRPRNPTLAETGGLPPMRSESGEEPNH